MKFVVVPKKDDDLELYLSKGIDAFLFGVKGFSVNYPEISLEEVKKLAPKYPLFLAMNKNIRNEELKELEANLESLSRFPIQGLFFYDLSILELVKRNKLPLSLVWNQTHMVTNYHTCNYYYNQGVSYGYLSNEITLDEMIEIKKRTKMKLFVQLFGYPVVSHSRRSLVTNYFKDVQKNPGKEIYRLTEKTEDSLLIKESKAGTTILFGKVINGTKPIYSLLENDMNYGILDMNGIERKVGNQVIDTFVNIRQNWKQQSLEERNQIIDKMNERIGDYTNFFYKKTIYKVKKEKSQEEKGGR